MGKYDFHSAEYLQTSTRASRILLSSCLHNCSRTNYHSRPTATCSSSAFLLVSGVWCPSYSSSQPSVNVSINRQRAHSATSYPGAATHSKRQVQTSHCSLVSHTRLVDPQGSELILLMSHTFSTNLYQLPIPPFSALGAGHGSASLHLSSSTPATLRNENKGSSAMNRRERVAGWTFFYSSNTNLFLFPTASIAESGDERRDRC
ncbi:hypothetical protein GGR52DRAFT_422630 [Hypoxylon sp. FL1284]|nr:hypothetical protein GGR52DRAFT_422630 [Hypoxylon sp. FL1284]